jgi:6-pyruvoyltetrahydropterin/6-carboxytetrahydropterin synthase
MIYLTRKEHFNAAHRLYNKAWSNEKNFVVFGKCANPNWHGHNYDLYITVKGEPDTNTGFIINAQELSRIIKSKITDKLDHKNMNIEVDFLKNIIPSTENVCKAIWEQLEPFIVNSKLHCVRLQETENIYAEYFGN